jgi:hypothetical protein
MSKYLAKTFKAKDTEYLDALVNEWLEEHSGWNMRKIVSMGELSVMIVLYLDTGRDDTGPK